jgi:hypothetical protein
MKINRFTDATALQGVPIDPARPADGQVLRFDATTQRLVYDDGASITWRGTWSANVAYALNDAVEYDASSYIAVAASSNQPPVDANGNVDIAYWHLLAAKGATGATTARQTVADLADNFTTTWQTVGVFEQSWQNPPRASSWKFGAFLAAPAGYTAQARLFDVSANAAVAGSTLSTASTTPTKVDTGGQMTVPAVNATHVYHVQIRIASGQPTMNDRAVIYSAISDLS